MNSRWQMTVEVSAAAAIFAGVVYCVLTLTRRRQISDQVSHHLTGAILSVMVGCKLINTWLVVNFRSDFFDYPTYVMWREGLFAKVPFWAMIYLFSAVTGHYLILATSQLIQEYRRKVLSWATGAAYGAAVLAMVATILLTRVLCPPYSELTNKLNNQRMTTPESTERYLTEWLEAEPDSPQARQLYRVFKDGYTPPDTRALIQEEN